MKFAIGNDTSQVGTVLCIWLCNMNIVIAVGAAWCVCVVLQGKEDGGVYSCRMTGNGETDQQQVYLYG